MVATPSGKVPTMFSGTHFLYCLAQAWARGLLRSGSSRGGRVGRLGVFDLAFGAVRFCAPFSTISRVVFAQTGGPDRAFLSTTLRALASCKWQPPPANQEKCLQPETRWQRCRHRTKCAVVLPLWPAMSRGRNLVCSSRHTLCANALAVAISCLLCEILFRTFPGSPALRANALAAAISCLLCETLFRTFQGSTTCSTESPPASSAAGLGAATSRGSSSGAAPAAAPPPAGGGTRPPGRSSRRMKAALRGRTSASAGAASGRASRLT
mmetsp:Transcript_45011/g.141083  ORF Transcript_45011/g.141083 Transcript_45011/m.141083 type:complete len:267 (+) Transcript_45011:527-1327(+)